MAKAASTFSSLKARANAALAEARERRALQQQQQGSGSPNAPASNNGVSGSWSNASPSQQSSNQQGRHARMNDAHAQHLAGYDHDAAPVSDDELAKVLAAGSQGSRPDRNSGGAFASSKSKPFLDRYGSDNNSNKAARSPVATRTTVFTGSRTGSANPGAGASSGLSGWDAVGRTGNDADDNPPPPPGKITINDNSSAPSPKAATPTAVAGGATVGAGAGVAAGAAAGHDDADSDDLEYVANPFEDEE